MNPIARTTVKVALVVAAISWGSQAFSQEGGHGKSSLLLGCGMTPNAQVAQDLRQVVAQTGGSYDSMDAYQAADEFMAFTNIYRYRNVRYDQPLRCATTDSRRTNS